MVAAGMAAAGMAAASGGTARRRRGTGNRSVLILFKLAAGIITSVALQTVRLFGGCVFV